MIEGRRWLTDILKNVLERGKISSDLYRVRHKKVTPRFVGNFLTKGIEFQCEILCTYLFIMYLHPGINSIQLSETVLKLLALR